MTATRNDNRWFTFIIQVKPLHSTPPHWEHKGVPFKNLISGCQRSCWHWSMIILISCQNWWTKGDNVTPTCLFLTSAGAVFSYWRKLFSLCTSAPILEIEVSLVISQHNNSRQTGLPTTPNGPQKHKELTEFSFGWSTLASKAFKPNCSRLFRRAWAPACSSFRLQISNGKKVLYINTHLIIVLVHQLPSLAVCSFGVHEVSNKSWHFLEVDRMMSASVIMVLMVVLLMLVVLAMLVCSQFSSRNLPLSSWPASGRCSSASSWCSPRRLNELFCCCSSLLIWWLRWWCW